MGSEKSDKSKKGQYNDFGETITTFGTVRRITTTGAVFAISNAVLGLIFKSLDAYVRYNSFINPLLNLIVAQTRCLRNDCDHLLWLNVLNNHHI
ncbi:MAG: hypothetical protein AAF639_02680 [Chloroflexota bacterium]